MTSPRMALAFWNTVVDCLVQFFGVDSGEALAMVAQYRRRLLARNAEIKNDYPDMIYHAEPVHVAGNLLHREVDYDEQFYRRYAAIQARNVRLSRKRTASVAKQLADLSREQQSASVDFARPAGSYGAEDAFLVAAPRLHKQLQ